MSLHSPSYPPNPKLSLDGWAVLAATVFVLLIVLGVLPRVHW